MPSVSPSSCEWCTTPCGQTPGCLCRGTAGEERSRLLNDSMKEVFFKKRWERPVKCRQERAARSLRGTKLGSCILLKLVAMTGHKSTWRTWTQKYELDRSFGFSVCLWNVGHFTVLGEPIRFYIFVWGISFFGYAFITRRYLDIELDYFYWVFMDNSGYPAFYFFCWRPNQVQSIYLHSRPCRHVSVMYFMHTHTLCVWSVLILQMDGMALLVLITAWGCSPRQTPPSLCSSHQWLETSLRGMARIDTLTCTQSESIWPHTDTDFYGNERMNSNYELLKMDLLPCALFIFNPFV